MPCPDWIRQVAPGFAHKLTTDPNLSDADREAFYAHVEVTCVGVKSGTLDGLEEATWSWKLKGQAVDVGDGERLGRAHSIDSVCTTLKRRMKVSREEARQACDELKLEDNSGRFDLLKRRVTNTPFDYLVWSFRNEASPSNPYDSVDVSTLPCRLGLGDDALDPDDYIFMVLSLPTGIEARLPTIADAGTKWETNWEPGGKSA